MGTYDDNCAREYWYPDWVGRGNYCISDGEEPVYMTYSPGTFLFSSKADCCKEHYDWDYEACVGESASGSGVLYYPDWTSGDEECKNDGNAPDYMVGNDATWLFSDKSDCCAHFFYYKLNDCIGTSTSSSGTGKYFPDWSGNNEACLQDTGSTRAPEYMQDSTTWLFDDLESCCDEHYSYAKSTCMGSSATAGSGKFYVAWRSGTDVCVKDCVEDSGTNCGGLAEDWDTKYDSQEKCCSTAVWYDYRNCMKGV